MMNFSAWAFWAMASVAYNVALTVNSRAKVSRSWKWNAWSSFTVGTLYVGSVVGITNEMLGSHWHVALAVVVYGVMSSLGSVIGQEIVLHSKFLQSIEKGQHD